LAASFGPLDYNGPNAQVQAIVRAPATSRDLIRGAVSMRPLEGIRVVELSTGIAGPFAGMLLADYGADLVKVEPPTGDPARQLPGFAMWGRNKQSVVLDTSTSAGRQRLADLLAGADLCITSDLQLVDAAGVANPGLIVLHMPPYTADDTPWAGGQESHGLLSAIGGPSCRQSSFDGGPIELVYPVALYQQGMWGAACATAALIEQQRSGLGQLVTVAGIHGVLSSCPGSFVIDPGQPVATTDVGPGGRHPTYSIYQCADGEWLFLAALTPKFQANAFKVLGVGDLHADPRIGNVPSRLVQPENRVWVRPLMEQAFASRPRADWLKALEQGDCPSGPLFERDGWLDHPQIDANGLRIELEDPERGRVMMPSLCIGLEQTPGEIRTPAPRLGEHTETAGRWPARPATAPAATTTADGQQGRGPLAGTRVLDLGTILAGPYAGSLLAGLGADVVKVESPAGDAFRDTGFVYNRGMRGLAIDLRHPDGQRAFHQLVATADVVIDNSRLGVAARLKADYASLAAINPRIVTLSIAGFGERGPEAHRPAFDPVLQAMSGMMKAQGGDSDPAFFTIPINDVVAAVTAVFAVCLGLYQRGISGSGQRTWTSLAASSLTMQSGEMVRFEGRTPPHGGGRDFNGPSSADRYYQASDGWLRVQAPSLSALAEALELTRPEQADCAAVSGALAALMVADALERLHAACIPAVPARQPLDLANDPALASADLLLERQFADGRPYLVPYRYARFSRTEQDGISEPPGIGEHSRAVLAEAGLSADQLDALVAQRVIVEGEPFVLTALVNYR
jgi:crotonobetainyl-CoA:carnitine CoA-transferase CaiB-like acyl-CoA transferase